MKVSGREKEPFSPEREKGIFRGGRTCSPNEDFQPYVYTPGLSPPQASGPSYFSLSCSSMAIVLSVLIALTLTSGISTASWKCKGFISFLAALQQTEFPGRGSERSCSYNLSTAVAMPDP